ncbi:MULTISPECIES: YnbE family lipoprotein [Microbulbifer]|uniref:YnbE family lipoprotein n=1 Tax=Microbulbifer celer TaxID=435905 RepID=A0ABW3UD29_9GAMM|nr:YnbE family lipoprotein [Microbulbifer sp.]UFN55788.1 YnbE family lipoprotein [Microbulbifer celer]
MKNHSGPLKLTQVATILFLGAIALSACTPTVAVQAPSEPITVNLNVKIEHEIRVKVDKELDNLFEDKEGIF